MVGLFNTLIVFVSDMKNLIKDLWNKFVTMGDLKVGDRIDLGNLKKTKWEGGGCPLCHKPTREELENPTLVIFEEKDLCLKHNER